jgi:hypothetical protein
MQHHFLKFSVNSKEKWGNEDKTADKELLCSN